MFPPLVRFVSTRFGAGVILTLAWLWSAAVGYGYIRMVDADAPWFVQSVFGLMVVVSIVEALIITFTLGLGRFVVMGRRQAY